MAGFPDFEASLRLACALVDCGVETIEIGVPFSDPLADGPAVQRAAERALANGITLDRVFELISRLKGRHPHVSVILFTYLNPLLRRGLEAYGRDASGAGVDATLTVDLPPEEAESYLAAHVAHGLKTVFLASPTTASGRVPLIARVSTAFVYYVSRLGVTGESASVSATLGREVRNLRGMTDRPIAVGFGVATPAQARDAAREADAVVIGSRFLTLIEEAPLQAAEARIREFALSCIAAIRTP